LCFISDSSANVSLSLLDSDKQSCSAQELSKFFFALGHVALKQLVHIEEIQSELRRRREAAEKEKSDKGKKQTSSYLFLLLLDLLFYFLEKANEAAKKGGKKSSMTDALSLLSYLHPYLFFFSFLAEIEEELGLTMGVTDELEAERMREVAEKDLVGKNLLGEFGPLLVKVCSDAQYDVREKMEWIRVEERKYILRAHTFLLLLLPRLLC
jgi:hypothetical protein